MRTTRTAAAVLLALLCLALFPAPAMAQGGCGDFAPLCDVIEEIGGGLDPVEDGLDPVTGPAAEALAPVIEGLQTALAELQGIIGTVGDNLPCSEIKPLTDQIEGLVDDAQGVLDVANQQLIDAVPGLEGLLNDANDLVDSVLDICVAAAGEGKDPDPDPEPTDLPTERDGGGGTDPVDEGVEDEELPHTGGAAALGGALLLGMAGFVGTKLRRR